MGKAQFKKVILAGLSPVEARMTEAAFATQDGTFGISAGAVIRGVHNRRHQTERAAAGMPSDQEPKPETAADEMPTAHSTPAGVHRALDSDLMSAGYERFEEAQEELAFQQITASTAMQRELITQMFTVCADVINIMDPQIRLMQGGANQLYSKYGFYTDQRMGPNSGKTCTDDSC